LGRCDAIISSASFKASLPYSCTPTIINKDEKEAIEIKDAYHPLIPDCVANSIQIPKGKGTLISGSNMSGKTSFLRTVGINILFAQTLSICLAKNCRIPPLRLFSSIRIADDVEEGNAIKLLDFFKFPKTVVEEAFKQKRKILEGKVPLNDLGTN